ncbi:ABC transporter ATP-binding protein [Penaeicola halotolerans]|uniref:ABC transporter ATP-binding protein n=1 Tax=Penaeicola halotolerans TaxID=2793196 RepID=UPI001CF7F5F2|nr:ABC transporter ATP-binding protein [Penaeicola halotolerans]
MNILNIQQVSKRYGDHQALSEVSLSVGSNQIFGLLGPNGAGKTTLIRIINQIINPDSGLIEINGEKLQPKHIELIGYLPEERGLYKKMKVLDQLLYLAQLKGLKSSDAKAKIKYWLERFDIVSWKDKKVEDLSKGMAQKIQFVATVMHDPKLIILDEPFSGFDPVNANIIKEEIFRLRDQGATIIFSTHRMESVEQLCDSIAMINKSKVILNGTVKEIRNSYKANLYEVKHKGNLSTLSSDFSIVEAGDGLSEELLTSLIKVPEGTSPNTLLQALLPLVEVHAFEEKIPSVNDIFIAKVQEVAP